MCRAVGFFAPELIAVHQSLKQGIRMRTSDIQLRACPVLLVIHALEGNLCAFSIIDILQKTKEIAHL
jgi:hypothetical protein